MGASIVADGDAPLLFQASEHNLDAMSVAVELLAMTDGLGAVGATGDAWTGAADAQRLAEPVGVVAPVGDEHGSARHGREHRSGILIVADLALGEKQDTGPAPLVADDVQLAVQPALGAPDTARNSPFLRKDAAVRCALRCVASTMSWSGGPPSAAS